MSTLRTAILTATAGAVLGSAIGTGIGLAGHAAADTLIVSGTCGCTAASTPGTVEMGGYLGHAYDGTVTNVAYPAALAPVIGSMGLDQSVAIGEKSLEKEIAGTAGRPTTVIGTSQGAVVIREYLAAHPEGTPGVTFISVADPTNSDGGILAKFPVKLTIGGFSTYQPAPATPDDRIEIVRQYDPLADVPDYPNPVSWLNTVMAANIHATGYNEDADPRAADNIVTVTPNSAGGSVTHIVIPTKDLPLTAPLRQLGLDTRPLDAVVRPIVDAGYDRGPHVAKSAPKKIDHRTTHKTAAKPKGPAKKASHHL